METKIKNLGVTLEQLYNEDKQLLIHIKGNPNAYTLVMKGRDKEPDFMLSSFSGNFYTRSNKGLNRQRYASLQGVENAVKRKVNKDIEGTETDISFSINSSIDIF